jgi:nucleotide-binding universal stress UspA family protein
MPGIVVGVDGSEHSERVLEWAMKEAALRQAPLNVITVHQVASSPWTGSPIVYPEDKPEQDRVRQAAEAEVSKVGSKLDAKPSSVTITAVNGLAAKAMIDASADADLVVVGSRGGGGFRGLTMGSVSSQVVNHAACPVVVVR